MHRIAAGLCCCGVLMLVACEGWPPDSEWHKSHFLENQPAFEELRTKILATDYHRAAPFRIDDTLMVVFHRDVYNEELDGIQIERVKEIDTSWTDLFFQARVFSVEHHDSTVRLEPVPARTVEALFPVLRRRDRIMFVRYTYDTEHVGENWICKPEYEKLSCGGCSVPLVDGWIIQYGWSPNELIPDALDQYIEGEISRQDYEKLQDASYEKRYAAGANAIDYKVRHVANP